MAVTLGVAIAGRYPWDRVRGKISALVVAVLYSVLVVTGNRERAIIMDPVRSGEKKKVPDGVTS